MKVNTAFILAAGLGTRMGPVGKILPKPLWKVFNYNLLELQLYYAKAIGCTEIFVNVHHCRNELLDFQKRSKIHFEILVEETLLDVGGAVHNLKRHVGSRSVVVLNSDLLFHSSDLIEHMKSETKDNVIFCIAADEHEKYNKIEMSEAGLFSGVTPWSSGMSNYVTYSGVSIINLGSFPTVDGATRFFDTVVNTKINSTKCIISKNYSYYDFGTLQRYVDSLARIYQDKGVRQTSPLDKEVKFDFSQTYKSNDGQYLFNFSKNKNIRLAEDAKTTIVIDSNDSGAIVGSREKSLVLYNGEKSFF